MVCFSIELCKLKAALIVEAKSLFSQLLKSNSNKIGHIFYFSERISKVFFSEHTIYGFGLPDMIKWKQGKSVW
jgi:hypothetical protein